MGREKKYYKYRYNLACPNCKEEHIYYNVLISEENQKIMDDYYKAHQEEFSLALMFEGPPLVVDTPYSLQNCDWDLPF